jgi:hypothetical protein
MAAVTRVEDEMRNCVVTRRAAKTPRTAMVM